MGRRFGCKFSLVFLTVVILAWAHWLALILRYPDKWNRLFDQEHSTLLRMDLSTPSISSLSQKYAKGIGIKDRAGGFDIDHGVSLGTGSRRLLEYLK